MFKNQKGFTLIELMVVIVIIGILATLAIPRFTDAAVRARASEAPRVLASYESAQLAYIAERGTPGNLDNLIMEDAETTQWYNYEEQGEEGGTYRATAQGNIGGIGWLQTEVRNEGRPRRTIEDNTEAAVEKYLPSFFATVSN
ncbi:Type IV pilin PilA [Chitinispirillum alkaliphilum]|nr:Type IV pilin PilA [Chitinispirillum alkaliphilum]